MSMEARPTRYAMITLYNQKSAIVCHQDCCNRYCLNLAVAAAYSELLSHYFMNSFPYH